MTKSISAMTIASMMLCLGFVSASAQGLPAGASPPIYGSAWATQQLQARNMNTQPVDISLSKHKQTTVPDSSRPITQVPTAPVRGG